MKFIVLFRAKPGHMWIHHIERTTDTDADGVEMPDRFEFDGLPESWEIAYRIKRDLGCEVAIATLMPIETQS